jgi:hypothetical protein
MAVLTKSLWVNEEVVLDGHTFRNATFDRCTLVFSALAPVRLEGCRFIECTWRFSGAAATMLDFLQALVQGGGEEVFQMVLRILIGGDLDILDRATKRLSDATLVGAPAQ